MVASKRAKTTKVAASSNDAVVDPENTASKRDKSLQEHLDRARLAVAKAKGSSDALHANWRLHLLRLSYIIIIVTLQQAQAPMTDCIKEFKLVNALKNSKMETPLSGLQAGSAILQDSVVEILSIVCTVFLGLLLNQPPAERTEFVEKWYALSTICVPLIVATYFQKKELSCIDDEELLNEAYGDTTREPALRNFPVALVFHIMVTVALWFMQFQRHQHAKNVRMVDQLAIKLKEAQQEQHTKKGK